MRRLALVLGLVVACGVTFGDISDGPDINKGKGCGKLYLELYEADKTTLITTVSVPYTPSGLNHGLLKKALIGAGLNSWKATNGATEVLRMERQHNSMLPYPNGYEEGGTPQCYVCCKGLWDAGTGEEPTNCSCVQGANQCRKCMCFG